MKELIWQLSILVNSSIDCPIGRIGKRKLYIGAHEAPFLVTARTAGVLTFLAKSSFQFLQYTVN